MKPVTVDYHELELYKRAMSEIKRIAKAIEEKGEITLRNDLTSVGLKGIAREGLKYER